MLAEIAPELRSVESSTKGGHAQLPAGSSIQQIAFVADRTNQEVIFEFPPPIQRFAVLVKGNHAPAPSDLAMLSVPALADPPEEVLSKMKQWVEASDAAAHSSNAALGPSHWMTFQGAQLCWLPGRVAILAAPERLEGLRRALCEVTFYEAELRSLEQTLGAAWPQLEADMPLAFEFDQRSQSQRKQLRKRFQQVLLIRARLARIGPHVHAPFLHPPTLASQISERFRERSRLVHRHEFLGEQLEVFERVYEMCGQRANDFLLTRSGIMLEWVIIVLLMTQLLLTCFEMLTATGQ